jgi:hypothetical protein
MIQHYVIKFVSDLWQVRAHGRWFYPGTPTSSTTKTGRHDIAEILLKVAFNTINQIKSNYVDQKSKMAFIAYEVLTWDHMRKYINIFLLRNYTN